MKIKVRQIGCDFSARLVWDANARNQQYQNQQRFQNPAPAQNPPSFQNQHHTTPSQVWINPPFETPQQYNQPSYQEPVQQQQYGVQAPQGYQNSGPFNQSNQVRIVL